MVHGGVLGSIGDVHDCEPIRIGKLNILGAFPGARTEWGRGQHTGTAAGGGGDSGILAGSYLTPGLIMTVDDMHHDVLLQQLSISKRFAVQEKPPRGTACDFEDMGIWPDGNFGLELPLPCVSAGLQLRLRLEGLAGVREPKGVDESRSG